MKPNQKGFAPIIIILAVIAVLAVGGVGAWFFTRTAKPKPAPVVRQAAQNQMPQPSTAPVVLAVPTNQITSLTPVSGQIDTSTWQTYRNDEYGFEFKYPADLQLNGADIYFSPTKRFFIDTTSGVYRPKCNLPLDYITSDQAIDINGIKFQKQTGEYYRHPSDGSGDTVNYTISYSTLIDGQCVEFGFIEESPIEKATSSDKNAQIHDVSMEPEAKVVYQMLSTLKLVPPQPINTDISTWQTYRNDEYGFEFRYPNAFKIDSNDTGIKNGVLGLQGNCVSVTVEASKPEDKNIDDWYGKRRGFIETPSNYEDAMIHGTITGLNNLSIQGQKAISFFVKEGFPFYSGYFGTINNNIFYGIYLLVSPVCKNKAVLFEDEMSIEYIDIYKEMLSTFKFIEPQK